MKQLNDTDIANMVEVDFVPDDFGVKKQVRTELHLSKRIPQTVQPDPKHIIIDFHNHTEEEAWQMLIQVAASETRDVTVITGASGILKVKFQQWATESILSPKIVSVIPINNGSFRVKFRKK